MYLSRCTPDAGICWLQIFKKVGGSAVRLLFIPGVIEAFFDGGIAIPIFGMPPAFAFALGFILKARLLLPDLLCTSASTHLCASAAQSADSLHAV